MHEAGLPSGPMQHSSHYTEGTSDPVLSALRLINTDLPELPSNTIMKLEHQMRQQWGGKRPYIAKTSRWARAGICRADSARRR